jgi:hypothetical protein
VPRGTVRIEAPAGLALDEARVTAWPRPNRYAQDLEEGPDRTFSGPWLDEGTWVRLEGGTERGDDFLPLHPLRVRLEGRGPWRLAPGTATLVVRIPMHAGGMDGLLEPAEGGGYRLRTTAGHFFPRALLDGDWVEEVRYDGRVEAAGPFPLPYAHPRDLLLTARGLRAGDHSLLVGAQGRRSMQARVRLREGETREVVVPLAPL